MADGLKVNGTALSTLAIEQGWAGLLGTEDQRGEDLVIPGRPGELGVNLVRGSRVLQARLLVIGYEPSSTTLTANARKRFIERWRALRALLWNGGKPYTLTRSLETTTGTLLHDATARTLRGLDPEPAAAHAGRAAVDIKLLDGVFFDQAVTTGVGMGTVTITGDAETHKVVVAVGGAGTVANATTGTSVTVDGATTLDVEAFTSTAGIQRVTGQNAHMWLTLAPGSNVISGPGGTTFAYRPAWE